MQAHLDAAVSAAATGKPLALKWQRRADNSDFKAVSYFAFLSVRRTKCHVSTAHHASERAITCQMSLLQKTLQIKKILQEAQTNNSDGAARLNQPERIVVGAKPVTDHPD